MYAAGEQGAWFDPSDLTTLFQDSAGTVPVTNTAQPVGLMLDKSGRGKHAVQAATINRPIFQQDGNGKLHLAFNGTNSWMSTAAIDFSGTDKMTVVAGVRKLSDAAQMLVELSGSAGTTPGAFYLVAGNDTGVIGGGLNGYTSMSRGSAATTSTMSAQLLAAAPDSAVLSATHDIAGDLSTLRRNGVNGTSATADKGTGNFAAGVPFYLGARAGTSLFFNGNFYGLILRGALSTTPQIASAEKYLAAKTGVTLL
jgi:hypothetical protein